MIVTSSPSNSSSPISLPFLSTTPKEIQSKSQDVSNSILQTTSSSSIQTSYSYPFHSIPWKNSSFDFHESSNVCTILSQKFVYLMPNRDLSIQNQINPFYIIDLTSKLETASSILYNGDRIITKDNEIEKESIIIKLPKFFLHQVRPFLNDLERFLNEPKKLEIITSIKPNEKSKCLVHSNLIELCKNGDDFPRLLLDASKNLFKELIASEEIFINDQEGKLHEKLNQLKPMNMIPACVCSVLHDKFYQPIRKEEKLGPCPENDCRSKKILSGIEKIVTAIDFFADASILILPKHQPVQKDFRIPRLSLFDIARLSHDVLLGLSTLHSLGYIHGDVSLSNLVQLKDPKDALSSRMTSMKYALIDLGMAQTLDKAIHSSRSNGTPGFIAPEVLYFASRSDEACNIDSSVDSFNMLEPLTYSSKSAFHSILRKSEQSLSRCFDTSEDDCIKQPLRYPAALPISIPEISCFQSNSSSLATSPSSSLHTIRIESDHPTYTCPACKSVELCTSRDIYSFGVVLGLLISPYLPSCTSASHLGAPRSDPEYVRRYILPPMRSFYALTINKVNSNCILALALDLAIKCLAYSPLARPSVTSALAHPFCGKAHTFSSEEAELWDLSRWSSSAQCLELKSMFSDQKNEWEVVSQSELDEQDAMDIFHALQCDNSFGNI